MNTRETLILKALELKALHSGSGNADLVDHLLEQNPDEAAKITKNVCAHVPIELAREMEQLTGLLGLNKREIITLALHDFLAQAWHVIEEFDALPKDQKEG